MLLDSIPVYHMRVAWLNSTLNGRDSPKVPTEDIAWVTDLSLKIIQSNTDAKRQKLATTIGRKFASPYVFIFMNEVEM